jgi:general secretion pathway protein D
MQSSKRRQLKLNFTAVMLSLGLAAGLLWCSLPLGHAQSAEQGSGTNAAPPAPAPGAAAVASAVTTDTNSPATGAASTNAPGSTAASTNAPGTAAGSTNAADGATNAPAEEPKKLPTDMISLSFQNMQIDQVLQWLSENTGKSVVKHPSAHCQVTIVGTKKVTRQEAVTMVYRALGMEGFTAIETATSILIVPADQELKMNLSPEMMGAGAPAVPGGRQRLVKVFALQHLPAADLVEKAKSVLSKDAVVLTDDRANLMIVTDYNDNLAAAAALIAALDVEKNDDVIVRVISLKNVNALDLAKQLQPLYQKLTGKSSKELIEVSASDTANSLMVLSSAANFKEIEKFAMSLDTSDAQEKIMRTFVLTNADAQDVAKQLQDLGKDEQSDSPYGRIFFFGGNPNGRDTKKMSIVADRRRNAILVQAPPAAMEGVAKTIAALDEPITDKNLAPKIVPLENVSAGDIEDVLNELFLKKTTQRSYYDDYFNPQPAQADRDVGRLYGKVRITSVAANNSLVITANSQENLDAVIAVVKELDKPSAAGDTTFHIKLNFGNAQKIANRINILFAKNGSVALRPVNPQNPNGGNPQPQQPQQTGQTATPAADDFSLEQVVKEDPYYSWLGGPPDNTGRNGTSSTSTERPVSDLVGRVRVVPDEATSSLLVTANLHLFAQVSKMIEDMDVPPPQVLIDARLVQISADYLDQIGVRYSPNGAQTFTGPGDMQNSFAPHAGGTYETGVGGTTRVNNPLNAGTSTTAGSLAQALTSLRSGVLDNTISMDFLIQFLHQKADATVISEPQITIADNDMGKLFVGQVVPIETGTQSQALGGSQIQFQPRNVGVIVEVEPHINNSGDVALRIRTESSTIDALQIQGQTVIDAAQFRTELTAHAGETLVLGGIIQKQFNDTSYKTPVLGSIPVLKYLFGKTDKSGKRTELLVFLRPKVVRTKEQAREMLEEVTKKMPLIENAAQEHKDEKKIK